MDLGLPATERHLSFLQIDPRLRRIDGSGQPFACSHQCVVERLAACLAAGPFAEADRTSTECEADCLSAQIVNPARQSMTLGMP
jgi:hypothetical protein